jgi:hypothetical protein
MQRIVRKFRSRFVSLVLSFSLVLACGGAFASVSANGAAQTVRLEREFKLRPGQQASLKGTKLRITFMNVKDDSRCPKDVTCVWAGNAAVLLWVTNGRSSKSLTLNTAKSQSLSNEVQYQGYKLTLVNLSPYPRSTGKIAKTDYRATLLVTKE